MILRIDDELLERFKEYCKSENKTVSEVIRGFVHTSLNGVHTPVHTESVCTDVVHTNPVHTNSVVHTSSQVVHTPLKKMLFDPLTGEPLQEESLPQIQNQCR